uniref:HDC06179 n=1 Tax=Drosophila melanogaster TaxID=7227 RepID=Q6IGJ4_DROME|nr:TPA_inf: HDC06179 [Drosophila melanogaster]
MEHKYNEPEKPSAENENQNKDGNQRGQLELWQRAANRGVSRIRNQGPRTKERGPRNCRQGAKKQSNIHLLFNTKTQFVHSPGNHQQTSPAGILLLHTHTHTHTLRGPWGSEVSGGTRVVRAIDAAGNSSEKNEGSSAELSCSWNSEGVGAGAGVVA